MNPLVLESAIQVITLAIQYTPSLVQSGETVLALLKSGRDPTPEEMATIRGGLDQAHAALQDLGNKPSA